MNLSNTKGSLGYGTYSLEYHSSSLWWLCDHAVEGGGQQPAEVAREAHRQAGADLLQAGRHPCKSKVIVIISNRK